MENPKALCVEMVSGRDSGAMYTICDSGISPPAWLLGSVLADNKLKSSLDDIRR